MDIERMLDLEKEMKQNRWQLRLAPGISRFEEMVGASVRGISYEKSKLAKVWISLVQMGK
jgi:hypothetical protein